MRCPRTTDRHATRKKRTSSSPAASILPEIPGTEVTATLATPTGTVTAASTATAATVHGHGREPLRAFLLVLAEQLRMGREEGQQREKGAGLGGAT